MRSILSRSFWLGLLSLFMVGRPGLHAHALGVVTVGEERQFELAYKNAGATPQKIGAMRSGCSCVTILDHPSVVPPGATVLILAMYKAEKPGRIAVQVEIIGTPGSEPVAVLNIGGAVTAQDWLLSTDDMANASAGMLVVDIRPPEAFAAVRAKRSLSLSPASLKKRTDLRSRPMLLMDAGVDSVDLLAVVAELRSGGFREVYALKGGIASWVGAGLPTDGEAVSAVSMSMVSPFEFSRSRNVYPWGILAIGTAPEHASPMADAVAVGNLEQAQAYLAASPNEEKNWLVVSANGNDYVRFDTMISGQVRRRIRYLEGGGRAWTAFIGTTQAVASTPGQEQISSSALAVVPSGGCGSCPR